VPAEVGKVGVESPTFIEPVQKRKDGIEAMFMRQTTTKAKESTTAAVGSGKRKHEPSSPSPASAAAATAPSSSPAKRAKAEKDPVGPKEIVDVDLDLDAGNPAPAEGHDSSDVEILSSSPGPYSPQTVIVPSFPPSLSHACVNFLCQGRGKARGAEA
jgi:hypothetical protein